jgi:solute carrier family 6 amino acid transporter-like protein 5/7/9/14
MNVPVDSVASSGPGLSFITFPEAILLMPASQVWALLFFFMMIILGLGSTFAGVQMITTSIIDRWPHLRAVEWKVTIATCMSGFVLGLPMTCHGGIYLFTLMEWHTASWAILLIGFAEVIILSWVYGMNNTLNLIKEMGMKIWTFVQYYWRAVWVVITPIYAVGVFIFILTDIGPTQFRGYVFPFWADVLGWMFGTATLVPFVVFAAIETVKTDNFWKLFKPTENWGPQEVDGRRVDRAILA